MKKKLLILAAVVIALYLLFPRVYGVDDGGSIVFETPVYSVTKYHIIDGENPDWGHPEAYLEGWRIEIFGLEVYDNVLSSQ